MIILGTNSIKDTGFDVANSCRFNSASNDHLNRTQTAGNRRKFTFSTWVKRCNPATRMALFLANRSGSNYDQFYLNESGYLEADFYHSGTQIFRYKTNALYRDTSAWYHMILAVDTEHDTASSRVRIYVNGLEVTSFSTETNPSENVDTHVNENSIVAYIGSDYNSNEPDYYLAETVMLDGTQATPTDFGEFDEDSGIWKPIDVSGLTFGTNGFYLDFENSGALGADVSGNSNNFTVNNLTAIDQSTDTCTNNFATWNPLENFYQSNTYSEGNLQVQTQNTSFTYNFATIGVSTGKWYWEVEYDAKSGGTDQPMIGITSTQPTSNDHELGNFPNDFAWYTDNGTGYLANNNTYSDEGFNAYTVGDVISVALDLDNNKLYFAKNGTWEKSGNPESGSTGTGAISITATASTPLGIYFPSVGDAINSQNATFKTNFGNPIVTGTDKTDGNSRGSFEYEPPSGYFALCTKNLAEYG